ncbi:hypothetical protein GRF29_185g1265813 [Pseudopithomyces chartarum]|uniref:RING-type domain-containing protein n=1 Tax=Pseudopithomyces chartarum TaxID=1892770 RepID=A0AAN6LPA4_9PLEO|nr:hypothetical protein GRF29_185g1265813 [Pseudopithomyces chartarum]
MATTPDHELISEDDLCPICHLLLFSPVKTSCAHLLCQTCMSHWATASTTTTPSLYHPSFSASSLDLDLRAFDPSYDLASSLEAHCPMCRTPTIALPHPSLAAALETKYPLTYAQRRAEDAQNNDAAASDSETVVILLGNRHAVVGGDDNTANKHDWTFFAACAGAKGCAV